MKIFGGMAWKTALPIHPEEKGSTLGKSIITPRYIDARYCLPNIARKRLHPSRYLWSRKGVRSSDSVPFLESQSFPIQVTY